MKVLNSADLVVHAGELTCLLGASGSGKTTLVSCLTTLLRPDEGRLDLFGFDPINASEAELSRFRREKIGLVFQQYNLVPELTVVENVELPLILRGYGARKCRVAAEAALDRLGLLRFGSSYPGRLSGGQQQRVAIARATIHEPLFLVCDEPTASLDNNAGEVVLSILSELAVAPQRAVLVVSHDTRVADIADRVIEMVDGKIAL